MLKLSELKPYKGATKRRKTVGRGLGSGHGTFSGRGGKGQKSRAGSSIPVGFEGGRMPLHRQLPKRRGFTSMHAKDQVLNLDDIAENFKSGQTVNPKELYNRNLIRDAHGSVKILGSGELKKALTFEKVTVSASAKAQIEQAGGKVVVAEPTPKA
jgi:large subunit ribosomal protein L15